MHRSLDSAADRRRKRIRDFVAMMQSWECFDTTMGTGVASASVATVQWTEEAIRGLFAGMYPWHDGISSTAELRVLASQFKECAAEVSDARCAIHCMRVNCAF